MYAIYVALFMPLAVLALGMVVIGIAWWSSVRDERRQKADANHDSGGHL